MIFKRFFYISCLAVIYSATGCGQLPTQQGRTLNFEVSDFNLPAAMTYSVEKSAPSRVPNISTTEEQAITFVQNIIMRSQSFFYVEDVLLQQGRSAGLSYDVISLILNQLNVTVKYKPLKCDIVFIDQTGMMVVKEMMVNCQIIGGTVMNTCMPQPGVNPAMCMPNDLKPILPLYRIISGTITTTNVIMANWSTQMWQIILNRALSSLTSGPLRSQFIGAVVTLK